MATVQSTTIPIAGLAVDVYSLDTGPVVQDVAIVLLLHGRTGSAKSEYVKITINSVLQYYDEQQRGTRGSPSERGLVIVTFDHRNHGSRLVHEPANHAWVEREDMPNPKHMVDQYALQVGAARDVSFLIDFLPSYLYPNGERNVVNWGVIGLSLGGDACWIALKDDPRINLGIPVIACPDYIGVMEFRAKQSRIPTSPPESPDSLRRLIQQHDVLATPFNQNSPSNPFLGKRILVLSAGEDTLVPFEQFCKPFVDGLEVGSEGTKRVVVQPGVGHEITDDMREEVAKFVWSWVTKA